MKIILETSNTLIDGIFSYIDEFIDGKMICGPGEGGFLQAILKKGIKVEAVKQRIKEIFDDSDIAIWKSSFYL